MTSTTRLSATPLSRKFADWSANLQWADIPRDVKKQVSLRVLDTTGLVLVGYSTRAGQIISSFEHEVNGVGASTVVGGSDVKTPPSHAALVHGTAAHCRDFDDTFQDSVVHPGSVVIPAAMALAEAQNASAEIFGTAIVAGYEAAARIGAVAGRKFHARGLHATGVVGPIAAAVTASRILGLDGQRTSWAMGLAASMSGGLMAFTMDGGWSKWLHAGWAAKGGIVAAQLAAKGFVGPENVLDGGSDLYSALLHGETIDRSVLADDLGQTWHGAKAQFKYYPCAHVIHPYIDGVIGLVKKHDIASSNIARIECAIAPWAAAIVAEPREGKLRFDTELEAIASLPYQLAVAAIDRTVGLSSLSAEYRSRHDVKAMASKIFHRNDESLGRSFDGRVTIECTSGARFETEVQLPQTDTARVLDKYVQNVGPLLRDSDKDKSNDNQIAITIEIATSDAKEILAGDVPDWRVAARLMAKGLVR